MRHLEILRRLILAVGLTVGLWLIWSTPPALYAVKPVDWEVVRDRMREREQDVKRTMSDVLPSTDLKGLDLAPSAQSDLRTLIHKETEGYVVWRNSAVWQSFFVAVAATASGRSTDPSWTARKGRGFADDELYFRCDEPPLTDLAEAYRGAGGFTYVEISSNSARQWLAVTKRMRPDLLHYAPAALAYPNRSKGLWILFFAGFLYAFLPWPRVLAESMRYSRARSSVVPDVMAAVFGGVFFTMPTLITNENAAGEGIFSPGWGALTAFLWLMAGLFFVIWLISAWYAALSLEWTEEGLHLRSLREDERFPMGDIVGLELVRVDPQRLNRFLLWASFLVSWRAFGSALMASRPEYAIRINRRDGRYHGFSIRTLIGGRPMIERLHVAGVPISEEVLEAVGIEPGGRLSDFPPLGSGKGRLTASILLLAPLAVLAWTCRPGRDLVIPMSDLPVTPYQAPRSVTWVPSTELMKRESEIRTEVAKLSARMKELESIAKTGNAGDRQQALTESGACLERIQKLTDDFDRIRREAGAPD